MTELLFCQSTTLELKSGERFHSLTSLPFVRTRLMLGGNKAGLNMAAKGKILPFAETKSYSFCQ